MKAPVRTLRLRILHDGAQPGPALAETLNFGIQDAKAEVHPGRPLGDGRLCFDIAVDVKGDGTHPPDFGGSSVHGVKGGRFLYLSWKRDTESAHPFGWRIKIPLNAIGWAEIDAAGHGHRLLTDATTRRPHKVEPVSWQVIDV
jgi:hypothetical protein